MKTVSGRPTNSCFTLSSPCSGGWLFESSPEHQSLGSRLVQIEQVLIALAFCFHCRLLNKVPHFAGAVLISDL